MSNEPTGKRSDEHPILEAFNAEDAVEEPGEPHQEPDTTSDSDAPAP